ncbi:TIGR00159 family protein [Aerococcaceae bacterium INB8]|uniref:Diadenylate cyclase n=1 Tax=Ruoffia halotolerans TaxID=2748684 RepID=A0A839A5N6_9LACT|nr:diadenylate cyclase CdaA [Ruoffia halotolerans]MBA5729312.1 TIGR00159 family protein [Ruoffia halotolerans]
MVLDFMNQFMTNQPIIRILDILLVWYLIYRLLMYARGTQMMNLLKGVGIFLIAKSVSSLAGLQTVDWLLGQILSWGVVAMIILFQPELRRALEILGRDLFKNRKSKNNPSEKLINDIEKSVQYMSKRKIGALISIEGQDGLGDYISTGIPLDAEITNQLLINIFIPNTPLHDGAVIIRDYQIAAASCYLPLSDSTLIPKELGTRHRAAIGLSEVTDAVTVIVSEETGDISVVKGDKMNRALDRNEFRNILEEYLFVDEEDSKDILQVIRDFLNDSLQRGDK